MHNFKKDCLEIICKLSKNFFYKHFTISDIIIHVFYVINAVDAALRNQNYYYQSLNIFEIR